MALQKTFTERYAIQLHYEVIHNIGIERYTKPEFEYDHSQVFRIPNVEQPEGLLSKMDASDDLKSAKALYEAYKILSPIQAADESFWTYLTHADLFPYVQKRNNVVLSEGFNDAKYIDNYFFHGNGGLIYHPLAGLWWDVHCSIDKETANPYKYTDYLFKDYGLRVTYMGRYALFRNKEEVFGILQFLMDNEDIANNHFRQRSRWISQYFNKVGAVKQLMSLNRDYFYSELNKLKDTLFKIKTDADVKRY
jgi:hypothetical protein